MKFILDGTNLDLSQGPHVMGILNVTPDSFSDGGNFNTAQSALAHAEQMIEAGASIIDIGGESSRPFSNSVSLAEELERVIPVIKAIRSQHSIPISIDTTKAEVAYKSLDCGANIINDISAFRFDPEMVDVARQFTDAPLIIMHMQGNPGDMQVEPTYQDVIKDTIQFFKERIDWLTQNGIPQERIIIDPGIGFGKTVQHNLCILKNIRQYKQLNCPILVGHSRKAFIGKTIGNLVDSRDTGTAVITALLAHSGVNIIRAHDVKNNVQALSLTSAIMNCN